MDEMEGSKYLSSIDLASGFLQLEIHEDDRHLAAFRDAEGKLYEYVRCGFGLTVPSAFANYVGGRLLPVKDKGIQNWLHDIAIPSKTLEDQWGLLRKTLECLRQGRLTVNLQKSHFCQSVMEFVMMIVDRLGTRPAPSKIDAIPQLSRPNTVEEVRVLLGMTGYLRQFVPQYSTVVAPISDLLRDPRFTEQSKAFDALMEALTAMISRRYCGLTLIRDVRDYVLSCACRRRKRSASQRVAILTARFLRPGEVLEKSTSRTWG